MLTYYYLLRSTSTYLALQLRSSTYLLLLTLFNQYLPCPSTPFSDFTYCYLLRSTSTYLPLQLRSNTTYLLQLRVQRLTYHYWLRSNTTYLLQLRSNSYLPLLTWLFHSVQILTYHYLPVSTNSFIPLFGATYLVQMRLTATYLACPFTYLASYLASNAACCWLN